MSTAYSVDLAFSAKTRELDAAVSKLKGVDVAAEKLKGKLGGVGREFQTAANGMRYYIDAMGKARKENGQFVSTAEKVAAGLGRQSVAARNAGAAINDLGRKSGSAQGAMSGLAALAGRLTAAFSVAALAQKAFGAGVGRIESERRLTALADVYGEVGAAQEAAARAAQRFGISQTEANQSFAQIYARLRPIGTSLQDIETAYNGFNTAAKLAGASTQEASSAWLQLSQALGSGVLRGEELNSVFEQTPGVVQAIAKEMNAPIGQIRQLAQDGKITSDIVIRALRRIETEGAGKLAAALGGPQQKIKNLQNAFENLGVAITRHIVPAITDSLNGLSALINNLSNALDTISGKSLGSDLMRRVSAGNFAGMAGARSEQLDQYERVLGLLNSPQKNRGGLIAQLQTARELSGRLRGIKATGNPEADARIQALQGKAMGLIQTFEGLIQGLDKATKAATSTSPGTTTPLQTKLDKDKEKLKGLQGRYIQGGYGPGGPNAYPRHFDIKRVDGSYFSRSELDRYVQVNGKPLSSGVTVPGGQFGASRDGGSRVHNAWDYAFPGSAALSLKGGAQWKGVQGGSYGDAAVFVTPDGKAYRIIHGKFEKTGEDGSSVADTVNDQLNAELEAMKVREESLQAGQEMITQETRRLALLTAGGEIFRQQLQIQYDYEDRQAKINELLDEKQKTDLTILNDSYKLTEQLQLQSEIIKGMADAWESIAGSSNITIDTAQFSTDKSGLETWIAESEQKLKEFLSTENAIKTFATSVGDSFGNAFRDVVRGTKSVKEAFASMLDSMADALIDYAVQAIAQYTAIAIAKALAGMLSGGSAGMNKTADNLIAKPFAPKIGAVYEGGGYTGNGARAGGLDGKGGFPAILHPGETVTDHRSSSARAALKGGGGGGAAPTINIQTGNVVQFEGANYVSMADFEMGLAKAANQGAERGHRKTLDKLRQSPQTRRALGM
jgi:tape measure domain-containing protein